MALDLATRRAAIVSGVRYELSLSIPEALADPLTGTTTIQFRLSDTSAPLVLDFETSREHVKSVEANGKPSVFAYSNGHIVIPAASLVRGDNTVRIAFNAGDASLNRNADFLYTLFVPARARLALPVFDQPDIKGRWTVTLEHPAAWQSAANGAELDRADRRHAHHGAVCRNAAPAHVSGRVHRRRFQGRNRGAQRPHLPDVSPRDRRRQGGAQSRRDFRSARARARVSRALHRHSLRVWQVRLRRDSRVPVRRHGARRQDPLQRVGPAARRVGDAEPDARPRLGDLARNRAHVVRRPGHHALVQRRVDEGSVRQLHGREDREPVVPGGEPRAAVPAVELPGRLRSRSHRGRQPDPPGARQPERSRQHVRRDHLSEGAGRDAPPRGAARRRQLPRRPARLPEATCLCERDLVGPDHRARRAHADRSPGMEPGVGRSARPADDPDRADREGRPHLEAGLPPARPARPQPDLAAAAAHRARQSDRPADVHRGCEGADDRGAASRGPARAPLRAAERRGLGLRQLRPRSRLARLPDDVAARDRRPAHAGQRLGDAVGRAARRTGAADRPSST